MSQEQQIVVEWMIVPRSDLLGPYPETALQAAVVTTVVHLTPTHPYSTNLTRVRFDFLLICNSTDFIRLQSMSLYLISCPTHRLCGPGEPSYDLLFEQSSSNTVYDPRVQKCTLQVSNYVRIYCEHCEIIPIKYTLKMLMYLLFNFSWEFEESEEDPVTSIPYQLQRLFVLLQTSKKRAIETTDVTRSFGWDSSEGEHSLLWLDSHCLFACSSKKGPCASASVHLIILLAHLFLAWQQHDVQELCRVMFDALEQKWKQTEQVGEVKKFCCTSSKKS